MELWHKYVSAWKISTVNNKYNKNKTEKQLRKKYSESSDLKTII